MPVPSDADVVKLAQDKYSELIDAYAGITEDNMDEVTKKLGDLGVLPESEVPQAPGRKRTRREVVNLVASKMADVLSLVSDLAVPDVINNTQLVVSAHRPPLTVPELPAPPAWASSLRDGRPMFSWDSEQYIAQIGLGSALTTAIVDTGASRTIIDRKVAELC